jgi:hypothetical protein
MRPVLVNVNTEGEVVLERSEHVSTRIPLSS